MVGATSVAKLWRLNSGFWRQGVFQSFQDSERQWKNPLMPACAGRALHELLIEMVVECCELNCRLLANQISIH